MSFSVYDVLRDRTLTKLFCICVVANDRALFTDFSCDASVKPGTLCMAGKCFIAEL